MNVIVTKYINGVPQLGTSNNMTIKGLKTKNGIRNRIIKSVLFANLKQDETLIVKNYCYYNCFDKSANNNIIMTLKTFK